jgi:hypothetical protein
MMGNHERTPPGDLNNPEPGEELNPRHFYAAYIYDEAEGHKEDVVAVIEKAKELAYSVRFWWLSDAMDLQGFPDRLIVCVHHPSSAEVAGMDLYEALKEKEVRWGELEAAAINEYILLGKPIHDPASIIKPDGSKLYPTELENSEIAVHEPGYFEESIGFLPLELEDIQMTAVEQLGRELNEAEMEAVTTHLSRMMEAQIEWVSMVRQSIADCVELGFINGKD